MTDITLRVQLQRQLSEALRETDEALSAVIRSAPLAVVAMDSNLSITRWNQAAERILGCSSQEMVGTPVLADQSPGLCRLLTAVLDGQTFIAHPCDLSRKDGAALITSLSAAPLHEDSGRISGAIALIEDITERTKAGEELGRVTAALASAREEEARRIARELHDDVTQRLAILSAEIGRAAQELPLAMTNALRAFQDRIVDASEGIRQISHRMHPSILGDLGLELALEGLCSDFEKLHGISVRFQSSGATRGIPQEAASCIYRVAQESLHNIVKYAEADSAHVVLSVESGVVRLQVIDSGIGFDAAAVKSGLGLHSMRKASPSGRRHVLDRLRTG